MNDIRQTFDSSFKINDAIIDAESISSMGSFLVSKMYEVFNTWGFVIIHPTSVQNFTNELSSIQEYFGRIIKHNRSGNDGISLISPMEGYPNYFGTTNEATGLHTDGSASPRPPQIVILQCEIPSKKGGDSQLLSCKALYDYLSNFHSEQLHTLFDPEAFTIIRDKETYTRPVFYFYDDRVFTVFRANGIADVKISSKASKAFELAIEFTHDIKNILQFKLRKNQVLIIDNTAVMHGRTRFPLNSLRKLNRVYLDGQIKRPEILYFGIEP